MKKLAFSALLASLTIAGCNYPATPTAAGPVNGNVVHIANNAFNPANIVIKTGQRVTWINDDSIAHTVTGRNFDSGNLNSGQSYKHQFNHRGEYHYNCRLHPDMQGSVLVQ